MKIGYCVAPMPFMASYRMRVAIPAPHLGVPYEIGNTADVSFFYKHADGDVEIAQSARPYVYDVVNDHFKGRHGKHYREMIAGAGAVTCSSEWMRTRILDMTGKAAHVIDDPYENAEAKADIPGDEVLWFGHAANMASLVPYVDTPNLIVVSNIPDVIQWSPDSERRALDRCGVVLLTGNNPGASTNRVVKALRAGRFVVTPGGVESWDAFAPYIWLGDVAEGVRWALNNREAVCQKIEDGQAYLRARKSPKTIATQWMEVFGSIWPQGISGRPDGSASI